ncbi:MAG: O-antigen ligase family protein [Terriglobales bacterium]
MATWTQSWRGGSRLGAGASTGSWGALGWWLLGLAALLPIVALMTRFPQHMVILAAALPALAAAIAGVIYRPAWGACALILIAYWNASDVVAESFGFTWLLRIAIAGVLAAWLLQVLLGRWRHRLRWPLLGPLLLWAATQVICSLTAINRPVAISQLFEDLKLLAVFYIVVNLLRSPRWWRWGVDAVLAALALLSLPVLYQGLSRSQFTFWGFGSMKYATTAPGQFGWRLGGALGDPNFLAMVLVAGLPLAAMQALESRGRWWRRLWALGVLALTLGAMLFTYSRGAAVGVALLVVALLVAHPRRKWVLLATIAGIVLATAIAPKALWGRLSTLLENSFAAPSQQMTDYSFRDRRHEMLTGLLMFADHPLVGVGPGNFERQYFKYSAMIGLTGQDTIRDPHSLYTQLLAETGLVGLAAFAWLLFAAFRLLERGRRRARRLGAASFAHLVAGFELALAVYLVCSIFLHDAYFRHFFLLLALGALGATLALADKQRVRRRAASSNSVTGGVQ